VCSENAGRARRGRRFSFLALALAGVLALPAAALAEPDVHLVQLRYTQLLGVWSCRGTDRTGAAFTSSLQWGFNDAGAFFFNAGPRPVSPLHPVLAETWTFDTDGGGNVWRAAPDPGSDDPAEWVSSGWGGSRLTFIRMAAQSTLSRTFERTSPDHLTVRQQQGATLIYRLSCVRTVNDAPR
jgi:hypothetical protein